MNLIIKQKHIFFILFIIAVLTCLHSTTNLNVSNLELQIFGFKINNDFEQLIEDNKDFKRHADIEYYWKSEDKKVSLMISDEFDSRIHSISILSKNTFINRFPEEGEALFKEMGTIKGLTIKTGKTSLQLGIGDSIDDVEKIYKDYNFLTTIKSNEIVKEFTATNIGNYKEYIFTIKANQDKKIEEIEIFVDFSDDD